MNELKQRARELRQNQTDAEQFVWSKLRNRRFHGYKFRRQAVIGSYIVDFVCSENRLVVELDGGQHTTRQSYDATRTQCLFDQGYRVVRFWNHEVLTDWDTVEEAIWNALQFNVK